MRGNENLNDLYIAVYERNLKSELDSRNLFTHFYLGDPLDEDGPSPPPVKLGTLVQFLLINGDLEDQLTEQFGEERVNDFIEKFADGIVLHEKLAKALLKYYSLGEVVAIKTCSIANIDKVDLERASGGFRTRRGVLEELRKRNPEIASEINGDTPVTIITLKKFEYDLNKLKLYMNKK